MEGIDPSSFRFLGNHIFRDARSAYFFGFYNNLILQGNDLIIGTLELRTTALGRGAHRLHVFRLDVPRF